LLVVINNSSVETKDISKEVYEKEVFLLEQIQLNSSLRNSVLSVDVNSFPMDGEDFPVILKNKINNSLPIYLKCESKICEVNQSCVLSESNNEDVYARSVIISSNLTTYSPRKLKLFCWIDYSPKTTEEEEPETPELNCTEQGGICYENICSYYAAGCTESSGSCEVGKYCCSVGCTTPVIPPAQAVLSLSFSDVVATTQTPCIVDPSLSSCHVYTHTRTFTESNGVGVNLTEGQLCTAQEGSGEIGTLNYRIDENSELIQEDKKFYSSYSSEVFNLTFWGEDDNNHDIYIEQYMCVSGTESYPNTQIC